MASVFLLMVRVLDSGSSGDWFIIKSHCSKNTELRNYYK